MAFDATLKRRLLGVLFLAVALVMLFAGQTVLQERLPASGFLLYWLTCFVFTLLAIIVALRDVRALRTKAMKEQRGLLDSTLQKIESDAREKQRRNGKKPK